MPEEQSEKPRLMAWMLAMAAIPVFYLLTCELVLVRFSHAWEFNAMAGTSPLADFHWGYGAPL
jgi:hypothetical protein